MTTTDGLPIEIVKLADLRPHPRNYRDHPEDQREHIAASIEKHGYYRPVILADDRTTILAGHGLVDAALSLGRTDGPAVVLPYAPDSPEAIQVMVGDNELSHLGEINDRQLTELLAELVAEGDSLLGTGFDELMLATLTMVSRPRSEIADLNAAGEWIGLPEFELEAPQIRLVIQFETTADRDRFLREKNVEVHSHKSPGLVGRQMAEPRTARPCEYRMGPGPGD